MDFIAALGRRIKRAVCRRPRSPIVVEARGPAAFLVERPLRFFSHARIVVGERSAYRAGGLLELLLRCGRGPRAKARPRDPYRAPRETASTRSPQWTARRECLKRGFVEAHELLERAALKCGQRFELRRPRGR